MKNILKKIKEWKEWCKNDLDSMNDNIRDLFQDGLEKNELFEIIDYLEKNNE